MAEDLTNQRAQITTNNAVVTSVPVITTDGTLFFTAELFGQTLAVLGKGSAAGLAVSQGDLVTIHGGELKQGEQTTFVVEVTDISQMSVVVTDYGFHSADEL